MTGPNTHDDRRSTIPVLLSEFIDPGTSELAGAELWRAGRLILTALMTGINVIGAAAVLIVAYFVVPVPTLANAAHIRDVNAITAAVYIPLALVVGALVGTRRLFEIRRWLSEERPATLHEQRTVARAPLVLFVVQVSLWLGAALVFGLIDSHYSVQFGNEIAISVSITGFVTATCSYLFSERLLRPSVARALGPGVPEGLAVPGVATRILLTWALGTGLPVLGLVGIGAGALAGQTATRSQLAVAIVVLGGIGIGVGLLAVVLVGRAIADPIDSVRQGLDQVQQGSFDVRVPVYDGSQIGRLQLGFNQMAEGLEERERIREAFGTYVDPGVASHILQGGIDLAGEEVVVTVMFIDVRGFTAFAERTPAIEVVARLNELFEQVVPHIHELGGRVDKFIGDGLLAVFGAPLRLADHADRAVQAALGIDAAVRSGVAGTLQIGIGINSGPVVAGNVGGAGRLEFSVIGDPVNVAARVEAATRQTGDTILVAEDTVSLLTQPFRLEERSEVALKGKSEVVRLFAVLPTSDVP
jgi:adenylate cyclase